MLLLSAQSCPVLEHPRRSLFLRNLLVLPLKTRTDKKELACLCSIWGSTVLWLRLWGAHPPASPAHPPLLRPRQRAEGGGGEKGRDERGCAGLGAGSQQRYSSGETKPHPRLSPHLSSPPSTLPVLVVTELWLSLGQASTCFHLAGPACKRQVRETRSAPAHMCACARTGGRAQPGC